MFSSTSGSIANLKSDLRVLVRMAAYVVAIGTLSRAYSITDQYFAAQISQQYLAAHIYASYLPFFINTLGITVGFVLLVLIAKQPNPSDIAATLTGAHVFGLLAVLPVALLAFFFEPAWASYFQVTGTAGSGAYFRIQVVASILLFSTTIFKYSSISLKRSWQVLICDVFGNLINLAGNYLSLRYCRSPESSFAGLALSTLVAQIAVLSIYLSFFRADLLTDLLGSARTFFVRAKTMLVGEGQNMILLFLIPFCFTEINRHFGHTGLVEGYNIAFQLAYLLSMPTIALNSVGANWLSEVYLARDLESYKRRLLAIFVASVLFCLVPALIILATIKMILADGFHVTGFLPVCSATSQIMAIAIVSLTTVVKCMLRSFEMPAILARIELLTTYLIGIPTYVLLMRLGLPADAIYFGTLIPTILQLVAYGWSAVKLWPFGTAENAERRCIT